MRWGFQGGAVPLAGELERAGTRAQHDRWQLAGPPRACTGVRRAEASRRISELVTEGSVTVGRTQISSVIGQGALDFFPFRARGYANATLHLPATTLAAGMPIKRSADGLGRAGHARLCSWTSQYWFGVTPDGIGTESDGGQEGHEGTDRDRWCCMAGARRQRHQFRRMGWCRVGCGVGCGVASVRALTHSP